MPFDVDNDLTPALPRSSTMEDSASVPTAAPGLSPMASYLASLIAQGKIEDPEQADPSSPNRMNRAAIAAMRQKLPSIDRQSRPGGELTSPRDRLGSWKLDLHLPLHPPRRVVMRVMGGSSSKQQLFVVGGLTPEATVQDLIDHVRRRLRSGPHTHVVVEHHGRALEPPRTLGQSALQDDAKLVVRLMERRPSGDRGLRRLHVSCTALCTRTIDLESPGIKGLAFKELIEMAIGRPSAMGEPGTYEWWDAEGNCTRITNGQTCLAVGECAADENAGTSATTLGEELIVDSNQSASLRGGKGTVTAKRMISGEPCVVSDAMVVFPDVTPEKMQLTFGGVAINDNDALYAVGCRTDDTVHLEFESPCVPPILTLLRTPAAEKPAKGGKKKK